LESGEFGGFAEMAADKGMSVQRLVIAWLMHYSPAIIPIPGPTQVESVRDTTAAVDVALTKDEVNHLTESLPESLPKSHELLPFPPRRGA
jgi:aryl-alcohol dehydrogenase-like predicted oxidoreductase